MRIALIKGDGIGIDVTEAAQVVVDSAISAVGGPALKYILIEAGARYYTRTGRDIELGAKTQPVTPMLFFWVPSACQLFAMLTALRLVRTLDFEIDWAFMREFDR